MIDISALMPQLSVLKQKAAAADISSKAIDPFSSVLTQKIDDINSRSDAAAPSLDEIDRISSLPDDLKSMIKDLMEGTPQTDDQLKAASKKLAVVSRGLVDILNNTMPGTETAQAEVDLQYAIFGTFQLLENYGYKPAVADLVQTWKTIDTRTDSYETLMSGLVDFIKTKACKLKGLKTDDTIIKDVTTKKITWEMQYELWSTVSAYGNTSRSQLLLKTFNDTNQMASAKVDLKGTKIDSLIDPVAPLSSTDF
jgi:flagellar hook-basal body complex protein FliE